MIRHCFYDGNDAVKNNNGVNDHADNCDNQVLNLFYKTFNSIIS